MKPLISCVLAALFATPSSAQDSKPATPDEAAIARWSSFGYGMFIHFGISTFTGIECDPGNLPTTTYAPANLDVDQWVRVARDAGMKYVVLTAKHVPGFCLWDSKVQWRGKEYDYDIATSGNTTDVVAAFTKACKQYGIMPGLYWCLLDFRNNSVPSGQQWNAGKLPDDFFQLAQDQIAELIHHYPDVGYYWLDIPRTAGAQQRSAIYDLIKRLRPGTVVLFNHGTDAPDRQMTIEQFQAAWPTDILNTERNPAKPGQFKPEQTWEGGFRHFGYEHCDTIHGNWFWAAGDGPRPLKELFSLYQKVRAGGGNLLLNVPPDKTGRIAEADVEVLLQLKQAIDDPSAFPDPLNLNAKASASNIYRNDPAYRAEVAMDENPATRWATDVGTKSAWLEEDLGKPVTIGRAIIKQAYPELQRVRKFATEYQQGDEWKACYLGEDLGTTLNARFEPVTARRVRLNITEATDGPTISEFNLFGK
ncbi:MAG: alpha-L-fucosidase [Akkermansiaceae bacterium]|nr:alpha-L-fucosidase [Akkermansiaceae bacterium]